jgi:hypothetical protein
MDLRYEFHKTANGTDLRDLFRDRLRWWSVQSGCNHDFSALVVGLRWVAVHDDRCSLPGSLPLWEIKLLGAPLAPEVFRRLGAAVPSDAAAFGFLKVGLHPALGRLGALFRVHLKIIRLSGPPALK